MTTPRGNFTAVVSAILTVIVILVMLAWLTPLPVILAALVVIVLWGWGIIKGLNRPRTDLDDDSFDLGKSVVAGIFAPLFIITQ